MSHLLSNIPYKEIPRAEISLSPRRKDENYVRPDAVEPVDSHDMTSSFGA